MSTPSQNPRSPRTTKPRDAESGTARRDSFVALLAHEIRNPLAPIRSGVALLKSPLVDDGVRAQTLQMMERQLSHLVRLVDDLLASVSVRRGEALVTAEQVKLADVLQAAIESAQPAIAAKEQVLSVSGADESAIVEADPRRLAQAFANLLNTGSKKTPWHGVLSVELAQHADVAVIRFSDSGPVLPKHELAKVFELYAGSSPAIGEELGIGLALVRGLVEMNGGTVEATDSESAAGNVYVVRLPIVRTPTPPDARERSRDAAVSQWRSQRVLVVDDNRDAAQTLGALLELDGHTIRLAHDGPSAVAEAAEFRPEIVLMDIGLPGYSGLVATQKIRLAQLAPRATVVALTGWGSPADREATHAAGCDLHLVKPIDYREIAQMLTLTPTDAKDAS